jgi:predicted phosphodiesterase
MRYLVLSDIHGNWEALQAVLQDAAGEYERICCLGDLVGYGADPNVVVEWVRKHVPQVIRGNHDKVCCGLEDPTAFNPIARSAAEWTRQALTDENRCWLRELARGPIELDGFLLVHGSVLDEDEYLLHPLEAEPQLQAAENRIVFFGHTHVQGGFLLRDLEAGPVPAGPVARDPWIQLVPGQGGLINPGSVGQPRDQQWQAAYALYDSSRQTVEFRRCDYDIVMAQNKIVKAGLPAVLARRLSEGR